MRVPYRQYRLHLLDREGPVPVLFASADRLQVSAGHAPGALAGSPVLVPRSQSVPLSPLEMQRFFPVNPPVEKWQLLRAPMKVDAREIALSLKRHIIHGA